MSWELSHSDARVRSSDLSFGVHTSSGGRDPALRSECARLTPKFVHFSIT